MPIQTITVNTRTYVLYPIENYTVNPDYVVQLSRVAGYPPSGGAPPLTVALFRWAGNGTTTFDYAVYLPNNSTLGVYSDIPTALADLDSVLYPS